jgi:O-antigen/teichoic acid export membrane protein
VSSVALPRSLVWVALDTGGVALFLLVAMLIMARLIGPEALGIAAIATGSIQVANLYAEGLLHDALIQHRETGEEHFRQAFWLCLWVGCALVVGFAGLAFALAHTSFAIVGWAMAATAFSLPFSAVLGVGNARQRRQLNFRPVAIPSVCSKLVASIISILLAVGGAGLWALVFQAVASVVIQLAIQTAMTRWIPSFTLDRSALRPLWKFALPYDFMHSLVGVRVQAFTTLAAATMGLSAAGYLSAAFRMTLTPQLILTATITNTALPMLSPHQDSPTDRLAAFTLVTRLISILMVPTFVGIAVCARPIIHVMLGPTWNPSIIPMQVSAITAAIYMLRMSSSVLLRSIGQVRFALYNAIAALIITIGGMLLLDPQTPAAASLFWLAPAVPLLPVTLVVVRWRTGITVRQQLQAFAPALLSAGVMVAAVLGVQHGAEHLPPLALLLVSVGTGITAYGLTIWTIDPTIRSAAANALSRLRGRARPI